MTSPLPTDSPRRKKSVLGPGTLNLGSVGTTLDLSCQITEITIEAKGDSEEPEMTLCGDVESGARTYSWTMNITAFQDMEADGVIDFTWKHAGKELPFKFVPESSGKAAVTGRVVIDPVTIGGTVGQKNKSEAEWVISGAPNFSPTGAAGTTSTNIGTTG